MKEVTDVIRDLNDRLRRDFTGGRWVLTSAVSALPGRTQAELFEKVREFSAFDKLGDDPYGEHDFGSVTVEGKTYFWKIDYYDKSLEYGSPDPTNPEVTERVLTVMLSSEY